MSLKIETANGIKWQVGFGLLQKAISFCTTIVLARILGPSHYGLFAMGLIIINAFGLFKSMGIESALIQRKDNIKEAANTAFFIIPILGITLYLLLVITAPIIGIFLNNKELIGVIRMLGLVFVFASLARVPLSLLEKEMKFQRIAIAETISAVLFSIVAVILAISGFGVWSLVFGYITSTTTVTIMIFIFSGWKPNFFFDKKIAKEMFHFGKFLFLAAIFWFLKSNLDNLLVGKLLGTTLLGFYAVAFNVANFSSDYFGNKVHRVVFPAYSTVKADMENLKKVFLKVFKYITIIAMPLGIGIYILGGDFLKFAYGEKWIGAIPVLKVLSILATTNLILVSTEGVLMTLGKSKLIFYSVVFQVIMFFALINPMAKLYQLTGVGIVVAIASCISLIFELICLIKLLSLNFLDIYSNFKTGLLASLAMGIVLIIIKNFTITDYSPKLWLLVNVTTAVGVYLFMLFVNEKNILKEMKKLIIS